LSVFEPCRYDFPPLRFIYRELLISVYFVFSVQEIPAEFIRVPQRVMLITDRRILPTDIFTSLFQPFIKVFKRYYFFIRHTFEIHGRLQRDDLERLSRRPYCFPFRDRITAPCVSCAALVFRLLDTGKFSQSTAAPLPLIALLLFNEPSVFTLRTLLPLLGLGERSQQLRAEPRTG